MYMENRATEQEERLELLRKRKRGEIVEAPSSPPPAPAAAAPAPAPAEGKEEAEDAVAAGAKRGLDNKGLKIPKGKEGYVEGARHEGHVHLFGNVGEQLGR